MLQLSSAELFLSRATTVFFVGLTFLILMCRTILYERIMNSSSAMMTTTMLFFVLARTTFPSIDRLKNLRKIVKIPVSVCTDYIHLYSYIELTSVKQQSGINSTAVILEHVHLLVTRHIISYHSFSWIQQFFS